MIKIFIDCIVNNAGMRFRKKFLDIKIEEFKKVFETNFYSIVSLSKKFINKAIKKKVNFIVNISSIVGSRGFSELSAYSSSKGALDAFTKCIAVEFPKMWELIMFLLVLQKHHILRNSKNKKLYNWTLNNTPVNRWGKTDEISNLIIFIIRKIKFYYSQNIFIDGGWTAKWKSLD